jgi:hypothetical protein
MKKRDVFVQDPCAQELLNNGVAEVKDTGTAEELQILRYELSTFVCDGQYEAGLRRILESYTGRPARPPGVIELLSIDYRLHGETAFPASMEDVDCAVRWLRSNAERYNVDPDRMVARKQEGVIPTK